jgi:hypothetical protein
MKAKVFDVVSHQLAGETPPEALEKKLNAFLGEHPGIQVHSTQLSSVVLPPQANASARSDAGQPSIIIFFTFFYSE